jgi:hypothetical protein
MTVNRVEPEREVIRRVLPYSGPALALALVLGLIFGGWNAGWSAGIGVAVVTLNFIANGLSVAWAARISPTLLFGVALGGFVVRLGAIALVMVLLNTLSWFSVTAFVAAVVPATIVLLVFEARVLSGRMQADLWTFRSGAGEAPR